MSFILNALRKSELERQQSQTESLNNKIIDRQPAAVKKSNSTWMIILVLINFLFLLYIFWSFIQNETDKPKNSVISLSSKEPATKKEPSSASSNIANYKKESTITTPKVRPIETAKINKPVSPRSALDETIKEKEQSAEMSTKKLVVNTRHIKKQPIQNKAIKEVRRVERKKKTPLVKQRKHNVMASAAVPSKQKREIVSKKLTDETPFLSELSYEFRRSVPSIDINVYVYSIKKENRFIMIDMKKYKAGEEIKKNMELKEIRKNSIVVGYKNKVFQIKRQ